MAGGGLNLLGYCKVERKRTPGLNTIEYTCLDETAKPSKGGDAKHKGLQLERSAKTACYRTNGNIVKPLTVLRADHTAA